MLLNSSQEKTDQTSIQSSNESNLSGRLVNRILKFLRQAQQTLEHNINIIIWSIFITILILILLPKGPYLYLKRLFFKICHYKYHLNSSTNSSISSSSKITFKKTSKSSILVDELNLIELKSQTYNGLVRSLRPGCRTIILLCDQNSKDTLIPIFRAKIWPYRLNKSLMFGYLILDKNLNWFKSLLKQVLCFNEDEDLNINMKNCNGTVLVLIGFNRYFRMYHKKHIESKYQTNTEINQPGITGELRSEDLLDGLSDWLDRLFNGETRKYILNEWPNNLV